MISKPIILIKIIVIVFAFSKIDFCYAEPHLDEFDILIQNIENDKPLVLNENQERNVSKKKKIQNIEIPKYRVDPVSPIYPRDEYENGREGMVSINIMINEQGKVVDHYVFLSQPEGVFDEAVIDAVKQWRFYPICAKSFHTRFQIRQNFNFKRQNNSKNQKIFINNGIYNTEGQNIQDEYSIHQGKFEKKSRESCGTSEKIKNKNVFRSNHFGFELTKPENWNFVLSHQYLHAINKSELSEIQLQEIKKYYFSDSVIDVYKYLEPYSDFNPSLNITVNPLASFYKLDAIQASKFILSRDQKQLKGYELNQSPIITKLNDFDAAYSRISYIFSPMKGKKFPVTRELWIVPKGDYSILIYTHTLQDEKTGTRAELKKIIDDLVFL